MQNANHLSDLDFIASEDNSVRSMWMVAPTGDYDRDTATGRDYALACIEFMRSQGRPEILGPIVRDMIASKQYGPIEIGFLAVIGRTLVVG